MKREPGFFRAKKRFGDEWKIYAFDGRHWLGRGTLLSNSDFEMNYVIDETPIICDPEKQLLITVKTIQDCIKAFSNNPDWPISGIGSTKAISDFLTNYKGEI